MAGNPVARWSLAVALAVSIASAGGLGLLVPWARELHGGPRLAGCLVAAFTAGTVLGRTRLLRDRDDRDGARVLLLSSVASLALLVPLLTVHGAGPTLVLMAASGLFFAYQVLANQIFVLAVPAAERARAFGVAGTLLNLVQGGAIVGAGLLADSVAPSRVVAAGAVLGLVLLAVLAALRPRTVVGK